MLGQEQKQQGDVCIVKIDALSEFHKWKRKTKIESGVVRKGTATGHSHRIVGTDWELFTILWPSRMFVEIKSDDCKMVHEEHEEIRLEPGIYEFVQTTEYDHFANKSRQVLD